LRLHIMACGVELLGRSLREEASLFRREMPGMKKLILLTAVGILTVGASGCRQCSWFNRGAPAQAVAMPAQPMYCEPCPTTVAPCDACGPCTSNAPIAPMVVAPGPETYVPAPVR